MGKGVEFSDTFPVEPLGELKDFAKDPEPLTAVDSGEASSALAQSIDAAHFADISQEHIVLMASSVQA